MNSHLLQSNDYGRLAKDKLHEADLALFEINSHRPEIDLHTLSVQRALRMLRLKIDYLRGRCRNRTLALFSHTVLCDLQRNIPPTRSST